MFSFRLLDVLFLLLYVSYRGKIKKRLKQIVISKNEKKDSSSKGKVEKEEEPSLIPLQVIDERFSEQPVVQPEAKWCVKQLVIASPSGDELEIKCSNLAVVVELLRKMSMI
jgi:hypothetical protein